jgi:hypothetical protein
MVVIGYISCEDTEEEQESNDYKLFMKDEWMNGTLEYH